MLRIEPLHCETPRWAPEMYQRSRAAPPVRKEATAELSPSLIGDPGNQRDHYDREVDVFSRAAPARNLDQVAQSIDQYDDLSEHEVGPAHAEGQAHRMPDVGQCNRDEHPSDYLEARGAQREGCSQGDVVNGIDGFGYKWQEVDSKCHGQENDFLQLAGTEPGHRERHQRRNRNVPARGHYGSECRARAAESAHQNPKGEDDRQGKEVTETNTLQAGSDMEQEVSVG